MKIRWNGLEADCTVRLDERGELVCSVLHVTGDGMLTELHGLLFELRDRAQRYMQSEAEVLEKIRAYRESAWEAVEEHDDEGHDGWYRSSLERDIRDAIEGKRELGLEAERLRLTRAWNEAVGPEKEIGES